MKMLHVHIVVLQPTKNCFQASPRLKLDETVVKHLLFRIRTEIVNETWFDEIQTNVFEKLQVI